MSFPNIPDVCPDIGIDACGAVSLLLASIAMEEMSLSRLMDAEREKLCRAPGPCGPGPRTPGELTQVNDSVNGVLKTMAKLQMLLQFKLEDVRQLAPCCMPCPPACTAPPAACPPAASCCCGCLLGAGTGRIPDGCGPFGGQTACVSAFLPYTCRRGTLRYTAGGGRCFLRLSAPAGGVRSVLCGGDTLTVLGTGTLRQSCPGAPEFCAEADFALTVRRAACRRLEFRMQLSARGSTALLHDSGFVAVDPRLSDLVMKTG